MEDAQNSGEGPVEAAARHAPEPRRHHSLAWQRFYWGVLDVSDLPPRVRRRLPPGPLLDERFQAEVPVAIDGLAVSYARISETQILGCGMDAEELELIRAAESGLLTCVPGSVPPAVCEQFPSVDPAKLNLLIGRYEPVEISRLRLTRRRVLLAAAACVLLVLGLGILRRASVLEQRAIAISQARVSAAARTLRAAESGNSSVVALERERALLVRTRTLHAQRALPPDAGDSLCAVLRAWPTGIEIQTQTLSATAQGVTVAAVMSDRAGAESFTAALGAIPGWTLQSPRVSAAGKSVRVDASLQNGRDTR